MATFNVTDDAAGGGDGSIGSPWTLAEARTAIGTNNTHTIYCKGTHDLPDDWYYLYSRWIGYETTPGDGGLWTLRSTANAAYAKVLPQNDALLANCIIDMNGYTGGAARWITGGNSVMYYRVAAPSLYGNRDDNIAHGCYFASAEANVQAARSILVADNAAANSDDNGFDGCILMGSQWGSIARMTNCINLTGVTASDVNEGNIVPDEDPFEDYESGDFRLTPAAKASIYAPQLKAIMAGLVNVPGIVTDPLADLIGGGGAPRYTPLVGNPAGGLIH